MGQRGMRENAAMVLLRLKYVMTDTDRHGNRRHYYRRDGRKIRLVGEPGSEEFMVAYHAAARAGKPIRTLKADPQSLRALLEGFYRSAGYVALDGRSQRVRRSILEAWAAGKDDLPYRKIERRHVMKWRDEKVATPGAATNLIKALRHMFSHAVDYDLMKVNPAMDVPYLRKKNGGFHTWTIEEVRQFEARHPVGTKARLAMALLLYTGQRRSDVVNLGRQMIRDGRLHYRQQKTGKEMRTLVIRPLQEAIDAVPSSGLAFLETHQGKPYTANGFGNAFRAWCDEAGLPNCSAHGLRKALAARLAELGATANQIKGALGHETLSQVTLYTRDADSMVNSDAALELFENRNAPPRLSTHKQRQKNQ